MRHSKQEINSDQVFRALFDALSQPKELRSMDGYHIRELIRLLQENSEVSLDDLSRIEWNYLPLLEFQGDTAPRTLEKRLSMAPEFFCEVVHLIYRSDKEKTAPKEASTEKRAMASNAWRLLNGWR